MSKEREETKQAPKPLERKADSARKTETSSKHSKLSTLPFPVTMEEAEKRIAESEYNATIFSPKMEKVVPRSKDSVKLSSEKKLIKDLYESPISK